MKEVVEIISVASTIAIDLAKKSYKIDIVKELNRLDGIVKENLKIKKVKNEDGTITELASYPMFMSNKKRRTYYKTTMDYVYGIFTVSDKQAKEELEEEFENKIRRSEELKTGEVIDIWDLVMRCDDNDEIFEIKKANDKQEQEIIDTASDYSFKVSAYQTQMSGASDSERDRFAKAIANEAQELQKDGKEDN